MRWVHLDGVLWANKETDPPASKMVRMSVLADCLKSIHNAEKRGKRQVRSFVAPGRRDNVDSKLCRCVAGLDSPVIQGHRQVP